MCFSGEGVSEVGEEQMAHSLRKRGRGGRKRNEKEGFFPAQQAGKGGVDRNMAEMLVGKGKELREEGTRVEISSREDVGSIFWEEMEEGEIMRSPIICSRYLRPFLILLINLDQRRSRVSLPRGIWHELILASGGF